MRYILALLFCGLCTFASAQADTIQLNAKVIDRIATLDAQLQQLQQQAQIINQTKAEILGTMLHVMGFDIDGSKIMRDGVEYIIEGETLVEKPKPEPEPKPKE